MNQYLLDTNICIHYLKGHFDLKNKVRQIGRINCKPCPLLRAFQFMPEKRPD